MNLDLPFSASFHPLSLYPATNLYTPDTFGFASFFEWTFRFPQAWYACPLHLLDSHSSFFPLLPHCFPIYSTSPNSLESSVSFLHLSLIEFWAVNIPPPSTGPHQFVFCPPRVTPLATGSLGEGVLTVDLSWLIPLVSFLWLTLSLHFFSPQISCGMHNIRNIRTSFIYYFSKFYHLALILDHSTNLVQSVNMW